MGVYVDVDSGTMFPITSGAQASSIRGIGTGMAERVSESHTLSSPDVSDGSVASEG